MIDAGLNIVASLVILEQQTDDKTLAAVIREVRSDVEGGMLLSQAMARHPNAFDRLYISMIEAGEAAGILDTVLDRVAVQIEKEMKIRRRVKGAMIYPMVVLTFAILTLIGMLLFLVPVFQNIFADLGGDLPTLTKGVVAASRPRARLLVHPLPGDGPVHLGLPALEEDAGGPTGVGSLQAARARRHRKGRPEGDDGALLAHARDARRGRRRHHQGARDLGTTSGNWVVESALAEVRAKVHQGVPIAEPLIENPVFPPLVSQMVKIGEETGELQKMLDKIADFYEDEVDTSIASLTSIIEPLMMMGVGAIIGIIVIAMYLPMFKLLQLVQ